MVFSGEGRSQYVLEGWVMAMCNLAAGGGVILMVQSLKRRPSLFQMGLAVALGTAVFAVATAAIVQAYTAQNSWYSVTFFDWQQFDWLKRYVASWWRVCVGSKGEPLRHRL